MMSDEYHLGKRVMMIRVKGEKKRNVEVDGQ